MAYRELIKSFTDNDIMLYLYILDILSDGCVKSLKEIADTISSDYLSMQAYSQSVLRSPPLMNHQWRIKIKMKLFFRLPHGRNYFADKTHISFQGNII